MKAPLLFLLLTFSLSAIAQSKEFFYVFDGNWKPTKLDSAHFLLHVHEVNDTCWQWDYYHIAGPLVKTEQYRDKDGNELDGSSRFYNERGWLDSTAAYKRGRKDGYFRKMQGDSLKWKTEYLYRNDSLINVKDFTNVKDSAMVSKTDKESKYPGGLGKWGRYLNKNLKYPDRAVNFNIEGEVRILFIVNKEGEVKDPYVAKSVEYSLDGESLTIVEKSGKWEPGSQNGKLINTYKVQPINFRLR
jgi:protein TonB